MPFDRYMEAILFALGTPNRGWEFIKRLVAASATGVPPPRQVLCRLLSLLEAVTEQEYR